MTAITNSATALREFISESKRMPAGTAFRRIHRRDGGGKSAGRMDQWGWWRRGWRTALRTGFGGFLHLIQLLCDQVN